MISGCPPASGHGMTIAICLPRRWEWGLTWQRARDRCQSGSARAQSRAEPRFSDEPPEECHSGWPTPPWLDFNSSKETDFRLVGVVEEHLVDGGCSSRGRMTADGNHARPIGNYLGESACRGSHRGAPRSPAGSPFYFGKGGEPCHGSIDKSVIARPVGHRASRSADDSASPVRVVSP
jgi:hypothetical protein